MSREAWNDEALSFRQTTERRIVSAAVKALLAAGYKLSVSLERGYDTAEMLKGSRNKARIMAEAFAGDECHIFVHEKDAEPIVKGQVNSIGWIFCVLGNDGWDIISDYTTNLETAIKPALELSNEIMEREWR